MYEEWFATMAKDPDMPTREEIDAIKDLIDEKTSAEIAAHRCTSRISEEEDPDPQLLWSLLETMAVELPDTQEKVVELLGAIKRLPNPDRNGEEYKISSEKVFSDLGYFETDFADFFRGMSPRLSFVQMLIYLSGLGETLRSPDSPECTLKWARINAFAARLTTSRVKDLRHRALETIEDAFNDKYLKERRTREFFLPAAANQIIYGAYPLWNIRADDEVPEWTRWRVKFRKLSVSMEVSEETKSLLRQAIDMMDTVVEDPEKSNWARKWAEHSSST